MHKPNAKRAAARREKRAARMLFDVRNAQRAENKQDVRKARMYADAWLGTRNLRGMGELRTGFDRAVRKASERL